MYSPYSFDILLCNISLILKASCVSNVATIVGIAQKIVDCTKDRYGAIVAMFICNLKTKLLINYKTQNCDQYYKYDLHHLAVDFQASSRWMPV